MSLNKLIENYVRLDQQIKNEKGKFQKRSVEEKKEKQRKSKRRR